MAYEELLIKTGINKEQAIIYEILLKNGVLPASKIALKAGIKRGLCYKVIDDLLKIGLIEKIDKKVALFVPAHPAKLKDIIKQKSDELEATESALSGILGAMTSDYNLFSGKPNVRFFEGEEGVKKVLEDSLYSKEEILSYTDVVSIQKNIPKINSWYVEQRLKKDIKKRGILLDTPEAREIIQNHHSNITNSKLIKLDTPPFETMMQIYDGKISYITFSNGQMIGVIVENQAIYEMHKALFDFTWSKAETI